jgi:hypothetical protein
MNCFTLYIESYLKQNWHKIKIQGIQFSHKVAKNRETIGKNESMNLNPHVKRA